MEGMKRRKEGRKVATTMAATTAMAHDDDADGNDYGDENNGARR
jgi:hypothetical protein